MTMGGACPPTPHLGRWLGVREDLAQEAAGEAPPFLKGRETTTEGFGAEPSPVVPRLWDGHSQFLA